MIITVRIIIIIIIMIIVRVIKNTFKKPHKHNDDNGCHFVHLCSRQGTEDFLLLKSRQDGQRREERRWRDRKRDHCNHVQATYAPKAYQVLGLPHGHFLILVYPGFGL